MPPGRLGGRKLAETKGAAGWRPGTNDRGSGFGNRLASFKDQIQQFFCVELRMICGWQKSSNSYQVKICASSHHTLYILATLYLAFRMLSECCPNVVRSLQDDRLEKGMAV